MNINKILKATFILAAVTLLLSSCNLPIGSKRYAALSVTSTPKTSVYLDGEQLGTTPYYNEKLKPGDYTIKLVPENSNNPPWETRVALHAGIWTVVSRELSETDDYSSGYILTLQPQSNQDQSSILVITTPDGSVVSIDNEPKGFAPVAIDSITEGDHTLTISSPGYYDKSIKAQLVNGYKLTANIQLSKSDKNAKSKQENIKDSEQGKDKEEQAVEEKKGSKDEVIDEDVEEKGVKEKEETKTVSKKVDKKLDPPYVIIQETNTGWLNVRKKPSTADDNVITKVDPGEKFPFLDSNDTGWYQIQLDDGTKGWLSGKYVKLVE